MFIFSEMLTNYFEARKEETAKQTGQTIFNSNYININVQYIKLIKS